ncbi:MAG: hypothetical protein Q9212_003156 [Teloschistes hypoglaucus]
MCRPQGDRNAAAVDTYRMEVETAALIRAAEDILSLTRVLKQMWLFGKLDTVGMNEAEARAEKSAKGVQEGLQKLMARPSTKLNAIVTLTILTGIYNVCMLNLLRARRLRTQIPSNGSLLSCSFLPPFPNLVRGSSSGMATSTSESTLHTLTFVVATTPSLGIGLRGTLPWPPLKSDLQFFARVTKRPPPATTEESDDEQPIRNAVIMGRKTFDSIPLKFRPLKDRINIVITRSPSKLESSTSQSGDGDVIAASSIPDGLQKLQNQNRAVGRVFVIGGAEIYKQAIELKECKRVLWTRLASEWECDTWFPEGVLGDGDDEEAKGKNGWRRRTRDELEDWTGEKGAGGKRMEGEINFEISMWERETDHS